MTISNLLLTLITLPDISEPWQLYYQDAASPIMEECIYFHDYLMFFLILIFFFVFTIMVRLISSFNLKGIPHRYLVHGVVLEIIWTLIPAIILLLIALPSFSLLYLIDEVINPSITFKAIGHQWYWSYELALYDDVKSFDSYMIPTSDLALGQFRLLDVDNSILLPINTHVRVIVTAADVIHSWTVPSLGVKLDGIPGTLNQTSFVINRPGTYYGQCSEICGFGHSYMPIVVKGVSINNFINWFTNL